MLFGSEQHLDYRSFRESSAGKPIVFLYPWTHYRSLFLKNYLQHGCEGLLYYRVRGESTRLEDWLSDLTEEFRHVFPAFGARLVSARQTGKPEEFGRALAEELSETSRDSLILFIDDVDRIAADEQFNAFLEAVTHALPSRIQIALSSSMVPSPPWNSLLRRGDAVVLGNHFHGSEILFSSETRPKPQLEVSAFGSGTVTVNGSAISVWDGVLPKRLFFYLLDNPMVTRDQIFEDFWPHLTVKGATDIFHVTKHKISEVIGRTLGQPYECELTTYKQGFYIPNEALVRHYDVDNYIDAIDRAYLSTDLHEVELFLTRALDLYRGDFLEGADQPWIVRRREELSHKHSEAMIWLAQILYDRGEDAQALPLLMQASALRPEREDVRRQLISLYARSGDLEAAQHAYDALIREIYEPLGIALPPETVELHRQIFA